MNMGDHGWNPSKLVAALSDASSTAVMSQLWAAALLAVTAACRLGKESTTMLDPACSKRHSKPAGHTTMPGRTLPHLHRSAESAAENTLPQEIQSLRLGCA
jgi:hypothetical protein